MTCIYGDAWRLFDEGRYDALCITTNGLVKKNGACVMGRGIAYQTTQRYPGIEYKLGSLIKQNGNVFQYMGDNLYSFPVKRVWSEAARLDLIEQSALSLGELAVSNMNVKFLLPRPGCGNGKLNWEDVKPVISPLLPDNVYVVTYIEH